MTLTLQHRDLIITITLHHADYGTDRWHGGYARCWPGVWRAHGNRALWFEIDRPAAADHAA